MAQPPQPTQPARPWLAATSVVVVILLATGMYYYQFQVVLPSVSLLQQHVSRVIDIVAYQWGFSVNGTDTRAKPIIVHVGDNVTFRITATFQQESQYSRHGFLMLQFAGMETPLDLDKGKVIVFHFMPEKPGDYAIICTFFCGRGHPDMSGRLAVEP